MDKAPDQVVAGVTTGWPQLRVVDLATGETIERVVSADAVAGKLVRTDVDENGNLKRDGDRFVTIEEDRAIRIEWLGEDQPSAAIAGDVVEPVQPVATSPGAEHA